MVLHISIHFVVPAVDETANLALERVRKGELAPAPVAHLREVRRRAGVPHIEGVAPLNLPQSAPVDDGGGYA